MNSLVAYYSRTGTTRTVAEALADALNADTEAITSTTTEGKGMGRLVLHTLLKTRAEISPMTKDPSSYDLVVVGTPVWAGNMSSPIRTYIEKNKDAFRNVAFFCTYGGSRSEKALKSMESLCGKTAVGTLDILERDVKSGEYAERVKRFATTLLEVPSAQ